MKKITIYSTRTCGYCRMLKAYLHSNKIAYEEKLVDTDPRLAQELLDMSQQLGVPFTIIEDEDSEPVGILGFDRRQIDHMLGL